MFDQELTLIRDATIAERLKRCIDAIPDYFWSIPASSTGAYHPKYALGEGGVYRHTRAAVRIGLELSNLQMFDLTDTDRDIIIFALVMHDSCKSGVPQERYTRFDHPILASNLVRETLLATEETPSDELIAFTDRVCGLIECHMGQWNTSKYSSVTLPVPHYEDKLELIVHLADYLASRKYLEIAFYNDWFEDLFTR